MDAIPLYMIKEESEEDTNELEISIKLGFKYIRYVSPNNLTVISGLKVYGLEAHDEI